MHYFCKENKLDACKGVGIWPSTRLNLLSPLRLKLFRLSLVSAV